MKKYIIAAGGTGGHITPALSIAKELEKLGSEILYIGNKNSLEEKLAKAAGFDFKSINVQKLYRKITFVHIKFPFKLIKSFLDSKKIISNFKPDAVIGTGGFVSGPVGFAAYKLSVPLYIQEQNSYPGLTTKMLSKYAKKIFLGIKGGEKYLPSEKTIITGNPINSNKLSSSINFDKYGFRENATKLFLIGGSQGSLALNKAIYPILDQLYANNIDLIWQVGKYSFQQFSEKLKDRKGIYFFDFTEKINFLYETSNFALARGGALTLAELESHKIPMLIVPLPTAAGNHQYFNAVELVKEKKAIMQEEKDLTSENLLKNILSLDKNYNEMKNNFKNSKHKTAAKEIANIIFSSKDK